MSRGADSLFDRFDNGCVFLVIILTYICDDGVDFHFTEPVDNGVFFRSIGLELSVTSEETLFVIVSSLDDFFGQIHHSFLQEIICS